MKPLTLLILCAGISLTCGKGVNEVTRLSPQEQLDIAYQTNSEALLHGFFLDWMRTVQPKNDEEIRQESSAAQDVYPIFKEFYNPFDLTRTGGSEWGSKFYAGIRYVIVQTSLSYTFAQYEQQVATNNFRPPLSFPDAHVVYLTDQYREVLSRFLADSLGWSENSKRMQFLNKVAKIVRGHWFGWHFLTHPQAHLVSFSADTMSAKLDFRVIYQGGEAEFRKATGEWVMTSARLTWIE